MVRASSPAKLRPWSELTAKMVMGVVPGLVTSGQTQRILQGYFVESLLGGLNELSQKLDRVFEARLVSAFDARAIPNAIQTPYFYNASGHFARIITLPALQKHFVNIFLVFAWELCIEKWWGFLVNFFWSPFPTKRSTKNPRKIREKSGAKFGAKFGTKILKIRGTFGLQLF